EDLKVLLRLWLPSFVCRDHEHHKPNGSDAGQHVAHEPLVAWDVDESDLASARQRAPRVAEVDREAPALLLNPPVRVHARQADDQRRLAVIDVAGGGDHTQLAGHAHPSSNSSPSTAYRTARARSPIRPSGTVRTSSRT